MQDGPPPPNDERHQRLATLQLSLRLPVRPVHAWVRRTKHVIDGFCTLPILSNELARCPEKSEQSSVQPKVAFNPIHLPLNNWTLTDLNQCFWPFESRSPLMLV